MTFFSVIGVSDLLFNFESEQISKFTDYYIQFYLQKYFGYFVKKSSILYVGADFEDLKYRQKMINKMFLKYF